MSYILEALKKAQAERQLGNAPTIHAPALHAAPVKSPAVQKSGALAVGVVAAVLAVAGCFFWSQRAPAPVVIPATALAPPPVAAPVVVPVPVVMARPEPAPVPRPRKPAAPVAPAPAPAPEDTVRYARDLPQEIQQQLPRVTFGGYMYSDNAADRLVLVDKTLRHEGEEIAPGLLLEKLLPKGAVLNFRGTRYRVAF
jgi:general secretion pathway protein B